MLLPFFEYMYCILCVYVCVPWRVSAHLLHVCRVSMLLLLLKLLHTHILIDL